MTDFEHLQGTEFYKRSKKLLGEITKWDTMEEVTTPTYLIFELKLHTALNDALGENKELRDILQNVNVVMDSCAIMGIKDWLDTLVYQDGWAEAHTAVMEALEASDD